MDCSNNQQRGWMRRPQMQPPYRNTDFGCTQMQTPYPMPVRSEANFSMPPCMMDRQEEVSNTMPPCMLSGQDEISNMPIGMGYVPWQRWGQIYSLEQGFERGTIFPELDYPFTMGGVRNDAWS